jgi:hypothetical protein
VFFNSSQYDDDDDDDDASITFAMVFFWLPEVDTKCLHHVSSHVSFMHILVHIFFCYFAVGNTTMMMQFFLQ